ARDRRPPILIEETAPTRFREEPVGRDERLPKPRGMRLLVREEDGRIPTAPDEEDVLHAADERPLPLARPPQGLAIVLLYEEILATCLFGISEADAPFAND